MKKILFICDPIENFKLQSDTTLFMMQTASEMGFNVFYCLADDLYTINDKALSCAIPLTITATISTTPTPQKWHIKSESQTHPLQYFDAVFVRNDPPFNMEYYYLTQVLSIAEKNGAKVYNNSHSLRNLNEKLAILNFPQLITPTLVTKNRQIILEFLQKHNQCVIKPIDEMGGSGIFKISLNDVNRNPILESSTNYYSKTVMLQEFIPEVIHGDRRVFVINGQVIDYCFHRIPQANEIRGNIAAGGRGEVHKINSHEKQIAETVSAWLKQQNIQFAGLDIIGHFLTEINITSPTCTRQIFDQTGLNIAQLILKNI